MINLRLHLEKLLVFAAGLLLALPLNSKEPNGNDRYWVKLAAGTRQERTAIANMGVAIEQTDPGFVSGTCDPKTLAEIKRRKLPLLQATPLDLFLQDFPPEDGVYHNFSEMELELKALAQQYPQFISLFSIGASVEGRPIYALRFNNSAKGEAVDQKPGVVFTGTHHAREHLSAEIPLLLAQYLAQNYNNPSFQSIFENRDIYIIPMVNPDGAEHDIAGGSYQMWRKNRRDNGRGVFGVDLNRNYGFKWNHGGSSDNPSSDVYMGPAPFSEPETQAIKNFIERQPKIENGKKSKIRTLITFHTFSELILYPWGHRYEPIENARDLAVFEKMAKTMAAWNGYTPEQSSELYIASGDTTDWAYGERGIFAFTFELTPKSMFDGGFYPGPGVIASTFQANLQPSLYLIAVADDPYKVLNNPSAALTGPGRLGAKPKTVTAAGF
ncbi:MAG: zinc carboxypeptidase [Elusimicrobia bacterium]|nr:zinc carboxypeptidase [Elusimicrobiota bacterium]